MMTQKPKQCTFCQNSQKILQKEMLKTLNPPPPPPPPPSTHTHTDTRERPRSTYLLTHLLMDSLLSLLIWNVLDFVDFKLVQEDLSSNRGAGHGWCLWPTFGLGTIHPWHPGSTNQPTPKSPSCPSKARPND